MNTVITISRQYGSGGRFVGRLLADSLGIPFYDKEIIAMASENSGFAQDFIKENEQKMNRITAESNTQLEQFTEYKYGIFQEVNGQLEGTVSFLLNQGEKLPVTSKEVLLKSLSSQIQIKVFRSKEKKFNKTEELPERCHSIQWFKFDVPKETICKFTITIEEDGNVVVCCLLPDGKMVKKSTAD